MYSRFGLIAVFAAFASAPALAEDYSPAQAKSWQAYCASELQGEPAFCTCVLDAQVREIGAEKVRVNLDGIITDDPDATEAESDAANTRLGDVDEEEYGKLLMLFDLSLETSMDHCQK